MYQVSELYTEILRQPHRVENRLLIAGREYNRAQIVALTTTAATFREECPSVGNCVGGTISLEMLAPDTEIPTMERMQLQSRIVGGGAVSEWIPRGTYFVNTRKKNLIANGEETTIEITGYDPILKLEAIYSPTGEWPRTDASVFAEILQLLDLESDEVLDGGYLMSAPDDETCREILGWIAASYGGNWIADGTGKLKLLRLGQSRGSGTAKPSAVAVGDILSPISNVVLHKMDGTQFTAGTAGRTLNVDCPWASQEMADSILATVAGYQYRPFQVQEAICDPSLELGDDVGLGIIYDMETKLFDGMISIIAAPPEEEVQHKYPFRSGAAGVAGRAKAAAKKTNEDVKSLIADVGVAKAGIEARVKYVDLEDGQWVNAHTSIFALAAGKIAAFDLYVKGISNGKLESGAKLVADNIQMKADLIDLQGKVKINGDLEVLGGELWFYGNGGIHTQQDATSEIGKIKTRSISTSDFSATGDFRIEGNLYAPQQVKYLTPDGSGAVDFFFEGGTARGLTVHSGRTGQYVAIIPGSALPDGGSWVMQNGSRVSSCYTGSLPRLTVTEQDGSQSQYIMDSGSWSIPTGTPAEDWFLVQQQTQSLSLEDDANE